MLDEERKGWKECQCLEHFFEYQQKDQNSPEELQDISKRKKSA
jgi:hypothetical protein